MEKFFKSDVYKTMKKQYEKIYFKINGEYAYYNGNSIAIKSASNIAEYFKNKKIVISVDKLDDEGEVIATIKKEKNFYQVWSEDPKMKEYREVVFDCDSTNVKDYQFNTFDGFSIKDHVIKDKKIAKEGLKIINDHISILCNHNKDGINTVKYYYAQALQEPHKLPAFCLVFISKEGVGKDMFSEFIENVFGEKYCFNTDKLDNICGKFNSLFGGKICGVINETDPVDSMQRRDNIKYVITAKKVIIEGKHKDPIKSNNYCRLTFYANRLTAFPIEPGSRRPYIQYCSSEKLPKYIGAEESKKYFDRLAKYMQNKDVQKAFYDELMNFDIESFNLKEQEKSELQKILEETAKSPLAEFLYELTAKSIVKEIKLKTTNLLQLYTDFTKKRNMKFDIGQKAFNLELMHDYKITKYLSCGIAKFRINVEQLKEILKKEHNYTFDNDEEDDDKTSDDDDTEYGIEKKDLSVKLSKLEQIEALKKSIKKLEKELLEDLEKEMYANKKEKKVSFPQMKVTQQIFEKTTTKTEFIAETENDINQFCENFF